MSLLHYYDPPDSQNIQIWNNAAFDDPSSVSDGSAVKTNWSPLRPISTNRLDQAEPDSGKENKSPSLSRPLPKKSPAKKQPLKVAFKEEPELDGGLDFDNELESIENEIERLSCRLEELRLKKNALVARRGRVVPAKFMEIKQTPVKSAGRARDRGLSLGPLEMSQTAAKLSTPKQLSTAMNRTPVTTEKPRRRGVSLGPLEIQGRLLQLKTPLQSHKKPNSKKLEGIEEEKRSKQVRIISPKSRPSVAPKAKSTGPQMISDYGAHMRGLSLGPTEIAAMRPAQKIKEKSAKREKRWSTTSVSPKSRRQSVSKASSSGQTKNLYNESRRQSRGGAKSRVVASRYSLAPAKAVRNQIERKQSKLPVADTENSPPSITLTKVSERLPRIRAVRCATESPRHSGCAKRVADLDGRGFLFRLEEDEIGHVSSYEERLLMEEDHE